MKFQQKWLLEGEVRYETSVLVCIFLLPQKVWNSYVDIIFLSTRISVDLVTGQWRYRTSCNWASEASPTLGCSIEISRDIYMLSACHMSYVVCLSYVKLTAQVELRVAHAHAQSLFFWRINQCYSFPIRQSCSMDEKEAEARPVMGTIFLVVRTYVCHICPLTLSYPYNP